MPDDEHTVQHERPRSPADRLAAGPELLRRVDELAESAARTARLTEENEGLADEVLRSYEQLNAIFDFTQQIGSLAATNEIESALIHRLFDVLGAEQIDVLGHDGARYSFRWSGERPERTDVPLTLSGRQRRQLEQARGASLSVLAGGDSTLCGTLKRMDERTDLLLVRRPAEKGEFTAGDLLLVESVLTLTGQILGNAEMHERLSRMSLEATRALVAAIDKKDHYTRGHSERVGLLSRITGEALGLPADELHVLEWSGLLHDVGKIGVPEEILNKPGRLTDEEFEVVKKHPEMGYEILKPLSSFKNVLDGVLYHHENPDGSGYPHKLAGDRIPLVARIIHVADVFDALTSKRSYRDSFSIARALSILHDEAGPKLDPDCVAAFAAAFDSLRTTRRGEFTRRFGHVREEGDNGR